MVPNISRNATDFCHVEDPGGDLLLYTFIILYIIIIVFAIFGNILIIVVVMTRVRMQTFTNILICNCACADLLITMFSAVLGLIDTLTTKGRWYLGSFMCSFVHFCVIASVASNILTLMIITVDRLANVVSPYKKLLRTDMLRVIIPTVWAIAFGFASPATFSQTVVNVEGYGYVCIEQWFPPFRRKDSPKHYTIVLFVCLYAVPLFSMFVIYVVMAKKLGFTLVVKESFRRRLTKSKKKSSPQAFELVREREDSCSTSTATTGFKSNRSFKKGKVVRMLILMLLVFGLCWLPVYLIQFLKFFHPYYSRCDGSIPDWAYATAFFVQYANGAVDPFLYFWFSSTFRKELKLLCQTIVSKCFGKENDNVFQEK